MIGSKNNIYKGDTIVRVEKKIKKYHLLHPVDIVLGKADKVLNNGNNQRYDQLEYKTKDKTGRRINYNQCIKIL